MRGFPVAYPGMRIGLLGGSFDPAHTGHVHITREALKRLGLDRVWWLVSPGNPLKAHGPAPMAARMAAARVVMDHPRVVVSDLEARLGTRLTADTLAALQPRYPGVRFVWLMGADNLAGLHRWGRWQEVVARVPLAVFARPGAGMRALSSPAARRMAPWRVRPPAGLDQAPGWSFLQVPLRHISSSELRAAGRWGGAAGGSGWDAEVDAAGLICPLPVLRARKRLAELPQGAMLRLVTTDPAAEVDVPHFCREAGHTLIRRADGADGTVWMIRRG